MPNCGTQLTICDVPVRFDTYVGCTHACKYCFVQRKKSIAEGKTGEGVEALKNFIAGKRTNETKWCDWDIPLHWGGTSDPFQPAEREYRLSYECLKIFAKNQYPVIISTKGAIIGEQDYIELLNDCNCAVQISLVCPEYDVLEAGAPNFTNRLKIIESIAKHKRVIVRIQPYMPEVHTSIINSIKQFAEVGAHGVIVEGMKFAKHLPGLERVGADFCYPLSVLSPLFTELKNAAHDSGMKFYSGENRLRSMGDSPTCCGVDDMPGFKVNKFNLNHYALGDVAAPTDAMSQPGSGYCFKAFDQNTGVNAYYMQSTFTGNMLKALKKAKTDGFPVR